jgi:hypothetical protein
MSRLQSWQAFLVPKLRRIAEFLTAQGITMAGNMLYGLLCVRLLPIADYAKFVVVFGIQGTLVVLMDIGISGSLIPLVGEHIDDRQLIADYVASLRQLAHVLFALMVPVTVIVYPLFVRHRQWSWPVVAAMVGIVLTSAWFARVGSAYGAVLILRRDRNRWYRAQLVSSLLGHSHQRGRHGFGRAYLLLPFTETAGSSRRGLRGQARSHNPFGAALLSGCNFLCAARADWTFADHDVWPHGGGGWSGCAGTTGADIRVVLAEQPTAGGALFCQAAESAAQVPLFGRAGSRGCRWTQRRDAGPRFSRAVPVGAWAKVCGLPL